MPPTPHTPATRARAAYLTGWARGWHMPERLSVWQWADAHRVLDSDTSKESGPWRTERNPPARAIMESLSPHSGAEVVTVVAGTQTVKTESMNNFVGYILDHDPASLVVCQPTEKLAQTWKITRFDGLVASTPSLAARINTSKRRDSANTMERVKFPGGYLFVVHAAAANTLGMVTARYVLADEVDSYGELKGGEGDPLRTLERRADSYGRKRKIFYCSSPKKIMGASLIWREYLAGDQREYWVPCPHCGTHQVLQIEQILPSGEYLCEAGHCGKPIPHSAKTEMILAGEWRAKYPERTTHHSYRLPSLYTPIGLGRTWKQLHDEHVAARGDPALMKAFVSTSLAIPWDSGEATDPEDLKDCRETWHMRDIPRGCLPLVAAVDCQVNRFELQILGFGRGPTPRDPQIYVIDYAVIPGSPLDPAAWDALDDYLSQPMRNAWGIEQVPRWIAVDSGNWTREVYIACHQRQARGWIAVKGASEGANHAPLHSPPKRHDISFSGRVLRHGGTHYIVSGQAARDTLLGRLAVAPQQPAAERWWHLPADLPQTWYDQMTAERRDPETGRWEKTRAAARVEVPDMTAYAWAIAHLPTTLRLGTRTARDWARDEAALQPSVRDLFADLPAPPDPAAPVSRATPARPVPPPPAPASAPAFGKEGWGL